LKQEYSLSIITVNFNGLADTCAFIDSIISQHIEAEVIVVDNGSKADEAAIIAQRYPMSTVKSIRSEENLGFAGGNNLGIEASTGDYLLFLNNDTELKDDWNTDALIRRLQSDERIGMVCPKIRFAWDTCPIQFAGYTPLSRITMRNRGIGYEEEERGQYNTAHPTPYAHGAAMVVKRAAMEKVGLMPDCYFLYYEEYDWSMMFRRAGYEIWYEPACTIYHKESKSTGKNSPLKTYYITRNRLLFAKRNIPVCYRYFTYFYIGAVVALRDLIKYSIQKRTDLIGAVFTGIGDFICGRLGRHQFS
jgi:GT2 family glycosyltransferase